MGGDGSIVLPGSARVGVRGILFHDLAIADYVVGQNHRAGPR